MEVHNSKQPEEGQTSEPNDIFGDPTVARTIDEDPILRFIVKNWQRFVFGLALIALVIYVRARFDTASLNRMTEASDLYLRVAEEYEAVKSGRSRLKLLEADLAKGGEQAKIDELKINTDKIKTQLAESEAKIKESLSALADSRPPYDNVAGIYRALVSLGDGDAAAAKNALADASEWQTQARPDSPARFVWELKALLLGRILLDDSSEGSRGRDLLRDLASAGSYLRLPAALSMARASDTDEERNEARQLLKQLESAYPDQSKLVEEELTRIS